MTKITGIVTLLAITLIFFLGPIREAINNLVQKEATDESNEEDVIGTTAIYNPRVKDVQVTLKSIGLYPDEVDGRMGVATRAAIMEFQKDNKLKPSGKVDSPTWTALLKVTESQKPAVADTIVKPTQPPPAISVVQPSLVVVIKPVEPEPKVIVAKSTEPAPQIQTKPAVIAKKNPEQPKSILSSKLRLKDSVKRIQLALKKSGFYHGEVDGKAGQQTRKAIFDFQKAKGLKVDGLVGVKTWQLLSKYLPES